MFHAAKNFCFALWRETGFWMRLSILRERLEPGERVARRDIQWPERQAFVQRATDIRARNRISFSVHTGMSDHGCTFCSVKNSSSHPRELRVRLQRIFDSVEHAANADRFGRASRIVNSSLAILDHPNRPLRQDHVHR